MRSAGESSVVAVVTGSILQTEAGLVTLSHGMLSPGVQQLVVAELVHAVEVPVDKRQNGDSLTPLSVSQKNNQREVG